VRRRERGTCGNAHGGLQSLFQNPKSGEWLGFRKRLGQLETRISKLKLSRKGRQVYPEPRQDIPSAPSQVPHPQTFAHSRDETLAYFQG
jgi:hypothetical protein